jgi:hypothetical protein
LGNEGSSTIIFPMPIDLLHRFSGMMMDQSKKDGDAN